MFGEDLVASENICLYLFLSQSPWLARSRPRWLYTIGEDVQRQSVMAMDDETKLIGTDFEPTKQHGVV
jgi:hypothetical protein